MLASAITLERTLVTCVAIACLVEVTPFELAPEVPRVMALFREVTMELMAESAVCIRGSTELMFFVYWSTVAEDASDVTIFAEAEGSSESLLTLKLVDTCSTASARFCWLCCIAYCTSGIMFETRILSISCGWSPRLQVYAAAAVPILIVIENSD